MQHRIAVGALVEHERKILMVRHYKAGAYDFWVAPGGGVQGTEDLRDAVRREVLEECGLYVEPQTVAYIEEFYKPETRECKFWFTARLLGGALNATAPEAVQEYIVEAAFLSREEFEGKIIFPPMLHDEYWTDMAAGGQFPKYVGIREMKFY
ncbi:MAG: NUDIX hydrolase [Candidatus Kapabacteria bacterium]|jgi:ADP-ribose pyrophosphatase YjhB (NUDIX family)|nr:NUDIX hydrolase [Candidatus Kapabacteria bacterium]